MTILLFELGRGLYALPLVQLREVTSPGKLFPIPLAPAVFPGAMNLKGHALPVLDLARLLDETQAPARILVLARELADLGLATGATRGFVKDAELPPEICAPTPDRPWRTLLREGSEIRLLDAKTLLLRLERHFPA